MTEQIILPCTFKGKVCLYCGDTSKGECEGFVQDKNANTDVIRKLQEELKEAKSYILAQEKLIEELVSQIETKDEIQSNYARDLYEMECACRCAISALYAYEPCIKNFGLLFGTGKECINLLKAAIGDKSEY